MVSKNRREEVVEIMKEAGEGNTGRSIKLEMVKIITIDKNLISRETKDRSNSLSPNSSSNIKLRASNSNHTNNSQATMITTLEVVTEETIREVVVATSNENSEADINLEAGALTTTEEAGEAIEVAVTTMEVVGVAITVAPAVDTREAEEEAKAGATTTTIRGRRRTAIIITRRATLSRGMTLKTITISSYHRGLFNRQDLRHRTNRDLLNNIISSNHTLMKRNMVMKKTATMEEAEEVEVVTVVVAGIEVGAPEVAEELEEAASMIRRI